MKTTLDLPDDLYREVKSRAALGRRKVKDYVAEGLRLALEADYARGGSEGGPKAVFEEIRMRPLHQKSEVHRMMEGADAERKEAWRDG